MKCKICDNKTNLTVYNVKEMMFGFRDEFTYFQCPMCQCLQIAEIPLNITKYYPLDYYSYLSSPSPSLFLNYLKKKRDIYSIKRKGFLGRLVSKYYPNLRTQILSEIYLDKNSKILDVGCGSGKLLLTLKQYGYNNIAGVDPYIEEELNYSNGLKIHKKFIHELQEKQDLIMFHHSFEHMPNPLETFQTVSNLLNSGGHCIIRIPTISSFAWEHYRENWVQLDAPRHFFLHSQESIEILAKKVSLIVEKIVYDSTESQFLGSERYLKGIPLRDPIPNKSIFSNQQIKAFKQKAKELNKTNHGDTCAFVLRKP